LDILAIAWLCKENVQNRISSSWGNFAKQRNYKIKSIQINFGGFLIAESEGRQINESPDFDV
jgi:hypothetical protein